jgi:hypothetical protein
MREKVTRGAEKLSNDAFTICTLRQILLGWSNEGESDGQDMWHTWKEREIVTAF